MPLMKMHEKVKTDGSYFLIQLHFKMFKRKIIGRLWGSLHLYLFNFLSICWSFALHWTNCLTLPSCQATVSASTVYQQVGCTYCIIFQPFKLMDRKLCTPIRQSSPTGSTKPDIIPSTFIIVVNGTLLACHLLLNANISAWNYQHSPK